MWELKIWMTNQEKEFFRLKQNQATNLLARFTTSKYEVKSEDKQITKITTTKFDFKYGVCDVTLLLDTSRDYGLNITTQKLYRYICCQFTEDGCNNDQIMMFMPTLLNDLGLKDLNTNRESVKEDCERLLRTIIKWSSNSKSKRNKTPNGAFNLISSFKFYNNYLIIEICNDLLKFMKIWSLVNYPKSVLQISGKSKYSFVLADKVVESARFRANFTISVRVLYDVCVLAGMPTIEEVRQSTNRSFKEKIITPFEQALNNNSALFKWKYKSETEHRRFEDWYSDYIIISNYTGGGAPP